MKMDNFEINSMKDDLCILSDTFEGTRESIVLRRAFQYINQLEEKLVEIANSKNKTISEDTAINLLRNKDYVVRKITKSMEKDYEKCEECGYEGDCMSCACSVCIMQ